AHSDDALASAIEAERRWGDLHDVGPAAQVEQIGAAEVVQIRLAVVAITDEAVGRVRRGVLHVATSLSATAMKLDVSAHGACFYHDGALRGTDASRAGLLRARGAATAGAWL